MKRRSPTLLAAAGFVGLLACAEGDLYGLDQAKIEADRVAVSGRVCAEDPVSAAHPVRLVLVVDHAAGPLFSDMDPQGERIKVLQGFIQSALTAPEVGIAVVGYAGRSQKLAPVEGNFTRNPGELLAAVSQLAVPEACLEGGSCRDYHDGLRTAITLIEGDMAGLPAGSRVLTQYIVLLINAGLHSPLALKADCCAPDDAACINGGQEPNWQCQATLDGALVEELRDNIEEGGAAGLHFHTLHLAAEPVKADNNHVGVGMQNMALAGAGEYMRINNINTLTAQILDVLDLRTVLRVKHLLVANVNAIATADGPVRDSDGDGLSDAEEANVGTSPGNKDTDYDGIEDLVEVLLGLRPLDPDEPVACELLVPGRDLDRDGLTDCAEAILGTDPSLVDTDGDALPDRLELVAGTDYLHPDAELDTDGDGTSNGAELEIHTDPRSTDANTHLSDAYRYELVDEGVVTEREVATLERLTGVKVISVTSGTTPGLGTLKWSAVDRTLSWRDPLDDLPGPPVSVGEEDGELLLPSSSYAPAQGDLGKAITVRVTLAALPPVEVTEGLTERLRILNRERHCLQYTIRNIRLLATKATEDGEPSGMNRVVLYFAEAPEGRIEAPGPYRMAEIPIRYIPPASREPGDAVLQVLDEEFVRPVITAE